MDEAGKGPGPPSPDMMQGVDNQPCPSTPEKMEAIDNEPRPSTPESMEATHNTEKPSSPANTHNTDNAKQQPLSEKMDQELQSTKIHVSQTAPTAVMQPQPSDDTTSLPNNTTLAGSSILRTRINNDGLEPTLKQLTPEIDESGAFHTSSQRSHSQDSIPHRPAAIKEEKIKQEEIKETIKQEPGIASGPSLFVHRNEDVSASAGLSLKRSAAAADLSQATNNSSLTSSKAPRPNKNKNRVEGYDDGQEKDSSDLAVDKQCFKLAENELQAISQYLTQQIDGLLELGNGDKETFRLRNKIRRAGSKTERYVPTCTVAFLGDMASGKSSLINSLLNEVEVAAASDDGESGTRVIHEYAMREERQPSKYRAVIVFHTKNKIRNLTAAHLASYWEYQNCDHSEYDDESLQNLQMESNTALAFFTSLLCGPGPGLSFSSIEELKKFLNRASSAQDKKTINALSEGIVAYVTSLFGANAGAIVIDANDVQELNEKKRMYAGNVKSSTPTRSPWRLVRGITVHLNARILENGLKLADCPGLGDSDRTCVQSTREYIKNCSTIIVTHPILRILNSDKVVQSLGYCMRNGRTDTTMLVCTKIDDYQHDRERTLSDKDAARIDPLRRQQDQLAAEISDLHNKQEIADDEDDNDEYKRIGNLLKEKERESATVSAKIRGTRIQIRNETVELGMKQKIEALLAKTGGDGAVDVPIFFVSNVVYNTHRSGYLKTNPPDLTVDETGVTKLRRQLLEKPAKEEHQSLRRVCQQLLRSAIFSLELVCTSSRSERKQELMGAVEKPLLEYEAIITRIVGKIKADFDRAIGNLMDSHAHIWSGNAEQMFKEWERMHHSRFKQFCRRRGVHHLRKGDDGLDWNHEIIDIMATDLMRSVSSIRRKIGDRNQELSESLGGLLLELDHFLEEKAIAIGTEEDFTVFRKAIYNNRESMQASIADLFNDLGRKLHCVRSESISFDGDDAYILKSISSTYAAAAEEKGSGSSARAKQLVKDKLINAQDNVFSDVLDQTMTAFREALDAWDKTARVKLKAHFRDVVNDFHSRFKDEEEVDTETRREFKQKLLLAVKEAQAHMDGPLKEALDECRQYK